MPLPIGGEKVAWPPKDMAPLFDKMRQWSAWYAGDLQKLQAAYGGGDIQDSTGAFASDKGGFKATVGRTLQRWFVGEPTRGPDRLNKLPIPLAAELCQASADLLFGEPVSLTSDDKATEQRLLELMDDRQHSTLAEACEVGAALGGVFLRATWDANLEPAGPFTTVKHADTALPEFRFGRLVAVTFWTVVERTDERVMRLLERHELNGAGEGVILFGLYQGKEDRLGVRVPLDASAATAGYLDNADLVMGSLIETKSPGLAVTYVGNQRPHRLWRDHATGQYLGRSDLDGIEHLLDQLAEVVSAWVRAIRLAKARIFIAKHLLKSGGPGNGAIADLEQEAYTQVESLSGADLGMAEQVHMIEPRVNFEQYQATAKELTAQAIQMAGYSLGTFGIEDGGGHIRTATEVEAKERRSLLTRERKIREWRPALVEHLTKLLSIDAALFAGPVAGKPDFDVAFSDGVQESQLALAQTALALFQSQSASVKERVKTMHPDWDEEAVDAEVALIEKEFAAPVMGDPAMDPFGGSSDGPPARAADPAGSDSSSQQRAA